MTAQAAEVHGSMKDDLAKAILAQIREDELVAMCCDVVNGAKPAPVYVVDDRPQLPPRFKPAYHPVHSSTTGGGGGALSARSAALADWIAAKEASVAPAMRSFFIGPVPPVRGGYASERRLNTSKPVNRFL